jgi:multidrug resistance efflux pump
VPDDDLPEADEALQEDIDMWTEALSEPDDSEPSDAADLWALRRATAQSSRSIPDQGSTATAEDLWAKVEPDGELPHLPGRSQSPERAAEAEALERLVRLNEELRARATPETPPPAPPSEAPVAKTLPAWAGWSLGSIPPGKIIKSLLALVVAVALAWVPLTRLLSVTSAEATINARLVNLRAPIDGTLSIVVPTIAVGTQVEPGETLLRVVNARADRLGLDELRRSIEQLRTEATALEQRSEELKKTEASLTAQSKAFQTGRIRQLEARAGELVSQLNAAKAQYEDARKSFERDKQLRAEGFQTVSALLHSERDFKVAATNIEAVRKRQQANQIELDGARKGLFIGDSYNDRPRSAQALDEVSQQIAELASQLEERTSRIAYLETELATESSAFAKRAETDITATVSGRVWEVLTADGEKVHEGQDLLRVLDCGGAVVTATVSESDYNELWIGQPTTFQMRGESREYPGSVVALTGLTPAGSNFAIEQAALRREPYHVTVAVPGLAALKECNVGRTGRVTFDSSATPAAAAGSTQAVP